jgi:predicted nucleotidyltransferase
MRIDKNDIICGLPAPTVRDVVRYFGTPRQQSEILKWVGSDDVDRFVRALEDDGWFQRYPVSTDEQTWWETTTRGNALAQSSFGKPISRSTAERHLREVIERAKEYNADPHYLMSVATIAVFGSYLDADAVSLGDLDLAVTFRDRPSLQPSGDRAERALAYAGASGRRFSTMFEMLEWPEREAIQLLRRRAAAIHITVEDVQALTNRWRVVYAIDDQRGG